MTEQLQTGSLEPIVCVYCTKFITFIEFDMENHLVENHHLLSGYCDTRSPTMERTKVDGRKLGRELDPVLLQQLNKDFQNHTSSVISKKYVDTDPDWIPAPTSQEVIERLSKMKSWSNNTKFTPIIPVERFFSEDTSLPLPQHPIEKSPCYPIVDFKAAGKFVLFSCSMHPNIENVNLESIEHHCRYDNPTSHKAEIVTRVEQVR
jgi:hypothetical protein